MKVTIRAEDEQVEVKDDDGNRHTNICQQHSDREHRDIFNGNIGTCLTRQIYNSCVLPAMTYGAETCKEQASNRTNKDGKEYVKHHIPGQKNKYLGKKKDQGHRRD